MLTIFTACDKRYEPFVLPFIASNLAHNPDAVIEIALEDVRRFRSENAEALSVLTRYLGDRYAFSSASFNLPANSVRFIATPTRRSEYVYIGDVDILVLEEIAPVHIRNMARTGLPYSNIKRPNKNALSGLHFSRWDAFYPQATAAADKGRIHLDEGYLYDLVATRGLPLPDPADRYRPVHGYHVSLNVDPRIPQKSWGGTRHPPAAIAFAKFRASPLWLQVSPFFDARYKRVLFTLEVMLGARFPDEMAESAPTPGISLRW